MSVRLESWQPSTKLCIHFVDGVLLWGSMSIFGVLPLLFILNLFCFFLKFLITSKSDCLQVSLLEGILFMEIWFWRILCLTLSLNDLSEWQIGRNSAISWFQEQEARSSLFYVIYGTKKNGKTKKIRRRFDSFQEANLYGSQLISSGKISAFQVCDEWFSSWSFLENWFYMIFQGVFIFQGIWKVKYSCVWFSWFSGMHFTTKGDYYDNVFCVQMH